MLFAAVALAGYLVKLPGLPRPLRAAAALSFPRWAYEAAVLHEFAGRPELLGGSGYEDALFSAYGFEDATVGVKVYLVVKDGEARWGWWDKEKQKWMMTWAELPAGPKANLFCACGLGRRGIAFNSTSAKLSAVLAMASTLSAQSDQGDLSFDEVVLLPASPWLGCCEGCCRDYTR